MNEAVDVRGRLSLDDWIGDREFLVINGRFAYASLIAPEKLEKVQVVRSYGDVARTRYEVADRVSAASLDLKRYSSPRRATVDEALASTARMYLVNGYVFSNSPGERDGFFILRPKNGTKKLAIMSGAPVWRASKGEFYTEDFESFV